MHESMFLYLVASCKLYLVFRCFQLLLIILWVLLFHSINKIRESEDILQKCIYYRPQYWSTPDLKFALGWK
jgi:hypothetical protein